MAERRRHKKRIQEVCELTKEEKVVAKHLRFNCPTKSTTMVGHQKVDYFIASKAVDCLLDSKWAKAKKGEEALFTSRDSVLDYCNRLLKKQFFQRALKVMKKKSEKDKKSKGDSGKEEEKKAKEKNKKKEADTGSESKKDTKSDDSPGSPKKKKEVKKKFKLELHEDQMFLDGNEVYVWIYDPVPFKSFAMGLILVIAVIAATLFPLWPAEMRVGVYYLSVAAGCFVASIFLLAVARCILFLLIWLVTGGRHHFWFLPNLTADVGFIDSFRPLYTHEYKGPRGGAKKGNKDEGQKSDSDDKSDSEKKDEEEEEEDEGKEAGLEERKSDCHTDTDSDRREDEGSQHSNGNDFEMITRDELDQHTEEDEEKEERGDSDTDIQT